MKKNFKRIIALLLCLIVLFSQICIVAFAEEKAAPIIYVHGYAASTIYKNVGTENEEEIFPPSNDKIKNSVISLLPSIIELAAKRDLNKLCDSLIPLLEDLFKDTYFDNSCVPIEGTGVDWEYPTKQEIEASNSAEFTYDWRLSAVDTASQLHDFIEYVKDCTGSSKVSLVCHSFGNSVGLTYVAKYGVDSLAGYISDSSAFYGENYAGELLSSTFSINGSALIAFLKDNVFEYTEFKDAGFAICDALELLFVSDRITDNADYIIDKVGYRIYDEFFVPWLAKWPSLWQMVPDEYYESARKQIFEVYLKDEDCSVLKAKLDEYDGLIRGKERREEILNSVASSCRFGVISKYNKQEYPVAKSYKTLSDKTVDVKSTSYGATCAAYGSTLPKDYTQQYFPEKNYISPDRMIDASTCLFPERTWFIKNIDHGGNRHNYVWNLLHLILSTDDFTVESDSNFPQFAIYNAETDEILPLSNETEAKQSTLSSFISLLKKFKELLLSFLSMLGVKHG